MKMSSALPGFPGSSHLYHIGSTGFFLDHPTHITLTSDQQMTLNRIKEKATIEQSDADRKIAESEQQMWQLTAADSPDADKIEAKAREVEKLRADQRLAFIRAVGEAAKVLTPEQQQVLLGTKPADAKKPMPSKMKM
jgi:Spy/CpxP family protein refolding chaperone